ncbi:DUF485 domain-containing protein [Paraburkholderia caballeronis]|uniref:Uncharacterized membrane protein, DUF485 family n=1 Tax=Paraburkholderia caballeronis TaxID=416943 RepID=A0A1H7L5T9_9BURK|nr:DUF485 domain-containing protein [Paraburkholderia caballeronis]PXW28285.1 uncharacterized membrane protein (DUF485 family) [Paraburkholderia caballeronis]PXX03651.1 uncharacterized membrane protein (DUF485 family) [Paraburkholderia caballeronis]RAK04395.1 uncharacterized membrane protein (DUF485 family) [Paraburkholderia caballeronis]SED81956.1 Uncharacterized membrane protein, DUF485 family [Paraburkholderia caballeronis]SEK93775.1 Uncharacterized membrane protein, DUF485 family [Paraburk
MEQPLATAAAPAIAAKAVAPGTMRTPINEALFRELVHKRRTFAWTLTVLMLVTYFGFVLMLAFSPNLLGKPIVEGQPVTWGIPIGFGMFVVTFALVAIYVYVANSVHDSLVADIRRGDRK